MKLLSGILLLLLFASCVKKTLYDEAIDNEGKIQLKIDWKNTLLNQNNDHVTVQIGNVKFNVRENEKSDTLIPIDAGVYDVLIYTVDTTAENYTGVYVENSTVYSSSTVHSDNAQTARLHFYYDKQNITINKNDTIELTLTPKQLTCALVIGITGYYDTLNNIKSISGTLNNTVLSFDMETEKIDLWGLAGFNFNKTKDTINILGTANDEINLSLNIHFEDNTTQNTNVDVSSFLEGINENKGTMRNILLDYYELVF